jgi:hypothetical protein
VEVANGDTMNVVAVGQIAVRCKKKRLKAIFSEVYAVPGLTRCLLSVKALAKRKVLTRLNDESVRCLKDNIVILLGGLCNQLYEFEFKGPDNILCKTTGSYLKWHIRLAHASRGKLPRLHKTKRLIQKG